MAKNLYNNYVMKKNKAMSHFSFVCIQTIFRFVGYFFVGYRHKERYKIKKKEPIVVLCNHQTDIDPILVNFSFTRLLRPLATDNIFRKGIIGKVVRKFGAIPKKKGMVDMAATMEMMRVVNNNESLIIFPEGNRGYAEFQYFISIALAKLLKTMKKTVVIFNLHGGNGTRPRFKHKIRYGKFYGEIKKVLKYEDYKDMPNEELLALVKDNLKVYDSESGELYKSKIRAEYLERMFFVCPACNSTQTLYSKKELITCQKCGFEAEFTEDLHLKVRNSEVKFTKLLDWYNYQKMWVKAFSCTGNEPIFWDENVRLFSSEVDKKKRLLAKGKIVLDSKNLTIGDQVFDLANIEVASPVSGIKLCFTHKGNSYQVTGHDRFNPLKYMFMFNKLDTKIHQFNVDNYFTLEEEIS